jgi:hypothetical protein
LSHSPSAAALFLAAGVGVGYINNMDRWSTLAGRRSALAGQHAALDETNADPRTTPAAERLKRGGDVSADASNRTKPSEVSIRRARLEMSIEGRRVGA